MNIIIVAKPFSSPRVVRLDDRRSMLRAGGIVCALLLTLFGGGLVAGTVFGGPSLVKAQLTAARNDLSAQRAEVGRMQQDMHRNTDALALRVGELQAEAARLNALGERIAKLGKLDDGEFNFDRKPGVGGPSVAAIAPPTPAPDIKLAVNRLDDLLASQASQLDLLESMLLDRQLDSSLMPSGSPVRSGYVSSSYGSRIDPFTGGHDFHPGIDFSGDSGDEILAVAGGLVTYAGTRPGYGIVVEIDHGNGYETRYGHNRRLRVAVGEAVRAGEVIAEMGSTGRSTGTHLHLEVWRDGRTLNPRQFLQAMR